MVNTKDNSKSSIGSVRHEPTYDSENLNRAIERAINDQNFLSSSLNLLKDLKFPAFRNSIVDYVRNATKDSDTISLFQNLDGYIEYKDQYHVRKAIEENDPKKKTANQITDETRKNPIHTQRTNHSRANSIKASKAITKSEERKDFPEVTPTAMSDFICKKCGKSYQTPDDLARHRRFEEGESEARKITEKSRTDRQRTVSISSGAAKPTPANEREPSVNKALNREAASILARLLEGLDFPASKEEIISHLKHNVGKTKRDISDDILGLIQARLRNKIEYNNVYEIGKATKLVVEQK